MKKYLIIIIIVVILIGLCLYFFYNSNNDNNTNENTNIVSGQRISTNVNKSQEENRISNILENKNEILENETHNKELFTFSTIIKDKSEGRLTNINITCSTLNNTIVQSGKTFSFNDTIGEPTASKGYQEASIIIDHKTEKGIGGRKLPSK